MFYSNVQCNFHLFTIKVFQLYFYIRKKTGVRKDNCIMSVKEEKKLFFANIRH